MQARLEFGVDDIAADRLDGELPFADGEHAGAHHQDDGDQAQ